MKGNKSEETNDNPVLQYETYRKYMIIFFIGIGIMLIGALLAVIDVNTNIKIPSPVGGMYVFFSIFGGIAICIFVWIRFAIFRYKGTHFFDERDKKVRNKAVYYGMLITIFLSTILIYVIDFLNYDLTTKTLIMIPITILCVSAGFFFWYFKRKGDVE